MLLKKELKNINFKIIQVIFSQYYNLMNYVSHNKVKI